MLADFTDFLGRYLAAIDARSPSEMKSDYTKFRHFSFEHVRDAPHKAAFESRIQGGRD